VAPDRKRATPPSREFHFAFGDDPREVRVAKFVCGEREAKVGLRARGDQALEFYIKLLKALKYKKFKIKGVARLSACAGFGSIGGSAWQLGIIINYGPHGLVRASPIGVENRPGAKKLPV
jgi:hypothetical protein